MSNTQLQSIVFNFETSPLYTREYASDILIYNTFSTIQTNTTIWTPTSEKRIYLTALQASSAGALTITLNRAGNTPFMSIILTATLTTYSESFPSPIKFEIDEAITLTTSASGPVNITLLGYEF